MMKKHEKTRTYGFAVALAIGLVFATASIILAGCASDGNGAVSAVRELHSMTPCGMMMETMMKHGPGSHGDHEADSNATSQPDPAGSERDHAHSPPAITGQ